MVEQAVFISHYPGPDSMQRLSEPLIGTRLPAKFTKQIMVKSQKGYALHGHRTASELHEV